MIAGLAAILLIPVQGSSTFRSWQQQKKRTVLLDRYYNSERKPDSSGQLQFFHYTWEEEGFPGFSELGKLFQEQGAELSSQDGPPDIYKMEDVSIYVIVDPDNLKDNPNPNYIGVSDIPSLKFWVEAGGVLVLMANDSANCDLVHLNRLSDLFGIHFSDKTVNRVPDDRFESGTVKSVRNDIISTKLNMFIKEACTLSLSGKSEVLAKSDKDVIMAYSRYGKGVVVAIGDPWLYNEYMDARRGLTGFDNKEAAKQLIAWLLKQAKDKKYIFN